MGIRKFLTSDNLTKRAVVAAALLLLALPALSGAVEAHKPALWRYTAPSCYYTNAYRDAGDIDMIVIHTGESDSFDGLVNYLDCPSDGRQVSAHYMVGWRGEIAQMVDDQDVAWHAGNYNWRSIGIENQGHAYHNEWTEPQYRALAHLTRWLADQYGVPKYHPSCACAGIVAHSQLSSNRGDPGPYFDWDKFINLVNRNDGGSWVGVGGVESQGSGQLTTSAQPAGEWRWAEYYWGLWDGAHRNDRRLDDIAWTYDACGQRPNLVHMYHQDDSAEYMMWVGGSYSRVHVKGIADKPGPVQVEVWVDGNHGGTVYLDDNDNCLDQSSVWVSNVPWGIHAVGIEFQNDYYASSGDGDRNLFLDGVIVTT